ncbi:MAG: hypothetical protein JO046_06875 [Solirubrobacterales bacterium]|nr:hypothetical protein [Solirubrobacterales bacterium]MBV9367597.1 hypothetical protein [Solirubrobacterales bacterium]MBV9681497.1 hypothetical protein [Solirubrobacterales bacterium]
MAVARLALASFADGEVRLSDEVELYQRTYMTLLRSSGETQLRVLEPSHMAMGSSLHPLAASEELDLGAFIYAVRRLPDGIAGAELVVMGQDIEALSANGIPVEYWEEAEAAARRRRWYDSGTGTLAVLLASASDVDDLVPTLVAFQIEWNKIRGRQRAAGWPSETDAPDVPPEECARELGGSVDDWARLRDAWGESFGARMRLISERRLALRVRMLGGSHTGYDRLTRRWWAPVSAELAGEGLTERPLYFVSSNSHSLVNIVTGIAREREGELVTFIEQLDEHDILRHELTALREGDSPGSWENFLYFVARLYFTARGHEGWAERRAAEREKGVTHLRSKTALRVPAQVIPLDALDPRALDPRLGEVDAGALAASGAVIVNIDYPLGVAAYNILREVAVDRTGLRGVYVLGKAATLNADVGDVMISNVVHDEHAGSTYWLDNAFSVDDLAPDLRFGTGLDNQRAVTVKSTFLQNRSYLDFYYREAFTVVEMETGPYLNAVYEIADADRHPVGEAINFSKLPIDLGVIHYASDTPYTQARTLGAQGLSYYGMDSTYASSLAILRRILRLERVVGEVPGPELTRPSGTPTLPPDARPS